MEALLDGGVPMLRHTHRRPRMSGVQTPGMGDGLSNKYRGKSLPKVQLCLFPVDEVSGTEAAAEDKVTELQPQMRLQLLPAHFPRAQRTHPP